MTQTTSPPRGLGVTAAAIARLLEDGGCHVIVCNDDTVIAETHLLRRVVFRRQSETTWDGAHLYLHRDVESGCVRRHELTDLRGGLVDLLDVGRFLDRVLA